MKIWPRVSAKIKESPGVENRLVRAAAMMAQRPLSRVNMIRKVGGGGADVFWLSVTLGRTSTCKLAPEFWTGCQSNDMVFDGVRLKPAIRSSAWIFGYFLRKSGARLVTAWLFPAAHKLRKLFSVV